MNLIFDLDETVIDSRHRTPNNPDGTLNLQAYIANHTHKNVFKDKLLPLAKFMRHAKKQGHNIIVLTARDMKKSDYAFLKFHKLHADLILSRDKATPDHYKMGDGEYKVHWLKLAGIKEGIMFDDSCKVKAAVRKHGIKVICAHKANKKLAYNEEF